MVDTGANHSTISPALVRRLGLTPTEATTILVDGSLTRAQSIKIHAARLTYGLVTLDTRVGRVPVLAVIDTGSERTLGNIALRDALMTQRAPGAMVQLTSVYGATEQVEPGELRAAPLITIESLRITDVAIVYGDFHIFKVWALNDRPAMIIGMDVLGTVGSLGIDFKNQNIYVANIRNSDHALPFSHASLSDMSQKK
jgi:predicted aspartyl protease